MGTGAEDAYTREGVAIALVRNAGAAFTAAGNRGKFAAATGTNGVTRTGAGVYTFTLSQGCPSANCSLKATVYGAVQASISVAHTSDTVKSISMFNAAGAAADFDFDLEVINIAPS